MVEIEIDGKKLTVAEDSTVIEAADKAGIYIPRFCYHKKLSIAANCRMCLVEVEKVGKPLPACATSVSGGMKVFTRSQKALQAQRAVMEFLLINHPLDCPICDQGGECELQDLSLGYGRADSEYRESKRSFASDNIGPLIETWMTRCIQCTRCVRFGDEIAGLRELGALGRGEYTEIGTYVKHFLHSELSGNIIDICPVGALTNKPARYEGRAWEYREHAAVAPHDAVGSNLFVHSRGKMLEPQRHLMRAVPRESDEINETWLSDRDRFSVHGLYHERVYKPRIKQNGQWVEVEWQRALDEIVVRTKKIIEHDGAHQIAALASTSSTVEEFYLLQKLLRGLGSNNIDHRLREQDFSDQDNFGNFPQINLPIAEIEKLKTILLIGSNVRFEQPIISHRINKAVSDGAEVIAVNPVDYQFIFPLTEKMITPPQELVIKLAGIAKALTDSKNESYEELKGITPSDVEKNIANMLQQNLSAAIFLGEHALGHPEAASIRALAHLIGKLSGAKVGLLTPGANSAGAWLAGAIPHRGPAGAEVKQKGLTAKHLFTSNLVKAYFLLNFEPELDCAFSSAALQALKQAELVVCLTPFTTRAMEDYADFILPVAPFTETAGTLVNLEGRWQFSAAASVPHQDAKPAWKILRVLANLFELPEFDYKTIHAVQFDIKHQAEKMQTREMQSKLNPISHKLSEDLYRLAPWHMYRVDQLVRRSPPLQRLVSAAERCVTINSTTAAKFNLTGETRVAVTQGENQLILPLVIHNAIADHTVLLPAGLDELIGFGQAESPIYLSRGQ